MAVPKTWRSVIAEWVCKKSSDNSTLDTTVSVTSSEHEGGHRVGEAQWQQSGFARLSISRKGFWAFNLSKTQHRFFDKTDVNMPSLTSVFQKTNVNIPSLTLVLTKSMLINSFYLQECHHIFVNIGFGYHHIFVNIGFIQNRC